MYKKYVYQIADVVTEKKILELLVNKLKVKCFGINDAFSRGYDFHFLVRNNTTCTLNDYDILVIIMDNPVVEKPYIYPGYIYICQAI